MDTITRRELLTRLLRVSAAAPAIFGTRAAQEGLILRLARLFGGRETAIGRWLRELWAWW